MNAQYNPQGTIIENLCKRYASSRVPAVRHEVSAQERSAVLDSVILSEAENVRITEREIDVYKNGNQYMDSDAYAEMFRARRAAARSEAIRSPCPFTVAERRAFSAISRSTASEISLCGVLVRLEILSAVSYLAR